MYEWLAYEGYPLEPLENFKGIERLTRINDR